MIVQCDQCSTKFKLDDAKLTETGVKVRCSKCRHIFVARKESPQEEPDLDSMLLGLDVPQASSPAPPSDPGTAPPLSSSFESSFANEEEPAAGPSLPVEESLLKAAEEAAAIFEEEPHASGNDFDFGAESYSPEAKTDQPGEFDFSAFEMPAASETPAMTTQEFDFEEMPSETFDSEAQPLESVSEEQAELATPAVAEGPLGGEFTFEEMPAESEPISQEKAGGEFDFSFSEPSWEPPAAEQSAQESFPSVLSAAPETTAEESLDFSFSEESSLAEEPTGTEGLSDQSASSLEAPSDEFDSSAAGKDKFTFESIPLAESRAATEQMAREVPRFAAADEPVSVPSVAFEPFAEEELPPLTISSRKIEGGASPFRTILLGVLLLAAVGAGVFYYLGSKAEKGGILPGLGTAAKGQLVEIVNVKAGYVMNKEVGELFVVRGEAVNRSQEGRGSLQVKGTVFGKNGALLVAQNAYCGNSLSDEQLVGMSLAAIEKAMANQFGDSLVNMELKPGKSIPFTIVFTGVPADAGDFGVEIAGSIPAKAK